MPLRREEKKCYSGAPMTTIKKERKYKIKQEVEASKRAKKIERDFFFFFLNIIDNKEMIFTTDGGFEYRYTNIQKMFVSLWRFCKPSLYKQSNIYHSGGSGNCHYI